MMKETREILYMALDLLDSIRNTSTSTQNFMYVDENKLRNVQTELFDLITQSEKFTNNTADTKTELIGTLPSVLIDKAKFNTNEDLVKLAEKSLNLKIPAAVWKKRSRNEIIGSIIAEIADKNENELRVFINAWRKFLKEENSDIFEIEKRNFVDIWLEFFDHYKGE